MTQPMTKKTIIAALAFAALVMAAEVSGSSAAAQVSQEFLGAWAPAEKQGDAPNCRRDDNDALMEIKSRSVGYWESGCAVSAFRRLKSEKRLAEVVLSCTGEETHVADQRNLEPAERLVKDDPSHNQHSEVRATASAKAPIRSNARRHICDNVCVSAWNKDPVFGVIGIQSGPRG